MNPKDFVSWTAQQPPPDNAAARHPDAEALAARVIAENEDKGQGIRGAFEAYLGQFEAEYTATVERALGQLVQRYGPTKNHVKRASEDPRDNALWHLVQPVLVRHAYSMQEDGRLPAALDPGRLARAAADYAGDTVNALVERATSKLAYLGNPVLRVTGPDTFTLSGVRGQDEVVLTQTRILNTSKLGKLFYQWPLRVTVNGKRGKASDFGG